MGICDSSNNKNQELLNSTNGPGIPPNQIIPQPVEVVNLPSNSTNQVNNVDGNANNLTDQGNKIETIQNQEVNPINSAVAPVSATPDPILNASNPNINNSMNQAAQPLNGSFNPNENNDLGQTVGQTQILGVNPNMANTQMVGMSQNPMAYNSQLPGSQQLGSTVDPNRQRMYIVVQSPGREIEITKLFEDNTLMDIEPFIVPDCIDEFDVCDSRGYIINDLLYTPFNQWHDVKRTLKIKLKRSGLIIPNELRNYIAQRTNLIGCLTFDKPNSFGLFLFNKMDNSTLSFEYSTNIYLQMRTVNQFSAYCNALNKLYISGGEIGNNQVTDSFICIDLNEVQQNIFIPTQLCNLKKRRYWHSMIYIPEKYIFIVGGPNETNVELYDIDKNITTIDSQLNTERCEPSLILVNNKYLYSIFGFHLYESFIDTIERCNLHKKNRSWEMVEYKLSNTPKLERAFFGVSYVNNNIILISDKENENDLKPNYILSPGMGNNDTISDEGILNSKNSRLFAEKFFIPFTENESINLAFKSGEPKIFIVNNNSGAINELCLDEYES
jgi:hypothetical protein